METFAYTRRGTYLGSTSLAGGSQRSVQGQSMLTVDETALLCWRLLETQGKCGCTWETFKEVPNELKQIVPVERRLLRVRRQDSAVVLTTYREYTESAARQLLLIISPLLPMNYSRQTQITLF